MQRRILYRRTWLAASPAPAASEGGPRAARRMARHGSTQQVARHRLVLPQRRCRRALPADPNPSRSRPLRLVKGGTRQAKTPRSNQLGPKESSTRRLPASATYRRSR